MNVSNQKFLLRREKSSLVLEGNQIKQQSYVCKDVVHWSCTGRQILNEA